MCSCTAVSDVVIEGDVTRVPADLPDQLLRGVVRAVDQATEEVAVIHIKSPPSDRLCFLAGQRAVLTVAGSLSAQLSIASCPCEDRHLEFHVRRMHGNLFSDYVFDQLKPGDAVSIRGPIGNFVLDTESNRPIVFLAFCNGFAAVKSLMEHAMALDQAESMHLMWIATNASGIYLPGLARAWADALDNFEYIPVIIGGDLDATASRQETAVARILGPKLRAIPALTRADVYVAGPSLAVDAMRKILLGLNVPEDQIYLDRE
jgi:CDP-4-dehydro-6-deoxyglucose reductase